MSRRKTDGLFSPGAPPLPANNVTGTGTDNRIARWNGANAIQDSEIEIADGGDVNLRFNTVYGIRTLEFNRERDLGTVGGGATNVPFNGDALCRVVCNANETLNLLTPNYGPGNWQVKVGVLAGPPVVAWSVAAGVLTWVSGAAPVFAANTTRFCRFYWDSSNWFGEFTAGF